MRPATRSSHRDQAAFTLVEAMIAVMVLALVFATVLALAGQALRYLNDIRRTARASQVLQQRMEDIRLLSWSQMQELPATFRDNRPQFAEYAGFIHTSTFDSYEGTTTVMRVTLSVTWTNQSNRVLTNTLTTLISQGGLNKYIF